MSSEPIVRTVDKFNKVINVANMEDVGKIPSGSLLEFVLGRKGYVDTIAEPENTDDMEHIVKISLTKKQIDEILEWIDKGDCFGNIMSCVKVVRIIMDQLTEYRNNTGI